MLCSKYAENTTIAGKVKKRKKSLLISEEKVNKALSKSETRGHGRRRNHGQANVQCFHCTKDMLLRGLTEEEGVDLWIAINVKDLLVPLTPNHLELEGKDLGP